MPALPVVPKVIKSIFRSNYDVDIDVINILHWRYATALSNADAQTFASLLSSEWGTHMAPLFVSDMILENVEIIDLSSASAPVANDGTTHAGGVGTQGVPAGSAMCVSQLIARRYRGGHPRIYLAGLPGATLTNAQLWGATVKAAVDAGLDGFANAVIAGAPVGMGAVDLVSVSYFEGFTPFRYPSGRYRNIPNLRVAGPVVDEITDFRVNPKVASQRRRNTQSS